MIEWSKYFDAIYVLSRTDPRIRQDIIAEINRVGMNQTNILRFNCIFATPLDEHNFAGIIPRGVDFIKENNKASLAIVLGLYNVFQECLGMGLKRILVVEDTCRFIDDLDKIQSVLDHLPENWDFIQFDRSKQTGYVSQILEEGEFFNGRYIGGFSSSVCNAYSLNAAYVGSVILSREFYLPGMLFANNPNEPRIHVLRRYIAAKNIIEHGDNDG